MKSALVKLAYLRFALVKSAFLRLASVKSALKKSNMHRSSRHTVEVRIGQVGIRGLALVKSAYRRGPHWSSRHWAK